MTESDTALPDNPDSRDRLVEENRRLAQRYLELESAARRQMEKLSAANAVLARGEADLRLLLENAAVGFALVDLTLRIASANKTLAEILGYAETELPGINFGSFVYVGKLPAFSRLANRNAPNAKTEEIIELVSRDGSLVPCRIAISDWLDDDGNTRGHFLLILDAGAELRASGRLLEMEQAMAETERSRTVFLEVIGRELRTPANGMMGMARMLLDAGLNDRQAELAGVIHSSASSLAELVDDVVDVVRMDAVDAKPHPEPVKPAALAQGSVNLFSVRAEEKGLDLQVHIAQGIPEYVLLDPHIMRRILAHLLDNALKFTDHGHVAVSIDIVADSIRFMVSDTGPGFDGGFDTNTWTAMHADSPSTRRYGGIGVGLAICRRLVASMGGRLGHESSPGHGSEFHVILPLALPTPGEEPGDMEPPAEALRLPPLRILLADANPLSSRVIKAYLGFDGHTLTVADSAVDAAEKTRSGEFDLIILDINLPKLGGMQTLKLIREEEKSTARKRIPVLILASAGQLREESYYIREGADGIVKKPIQPVELMAAAAAATKVKPVSISRRSPTRSYSAHTGGSSLRRLDGREIANLRAVMPEDQFMGILRFFMEDAIPGLTSLEKMCHQPNPDRQRIAFAASKTRGLAAYLGFAAMADVLTRMENAGRTNAADSDLVRLANELMDVTDDSLEELKRILPQAFTTISAMKGAISDSSAGTGPKGSGAG